MKFLTADVNISKIVVMVQKEVANRMCAVAGDSNYGSLSVIIAHFGKAKQEMMIKGNCFYPKPEVDSSVVSIEIEKNDYAHSANFIDFVRSCFKMKRKTLYNNLKKAGYEPDVILKAFEIAQIGSNARAQELCEKKFKDLIKGLTST